MTHKVFTIQELRDFLKDNSVVCHIQVQMLYDGTFERDGFITKFHALFGKGGKVESIFTEMIRIKNHSNRGVIRQSQSYAVSG